MAMVGAFLGGPGTTIPVGYGELNLFWTTSDGQNQQVTFNVTGPQTTSVQSDVNGQATILLPAGSYTVTPSYSGDYTGGDPKTVSVLSKETSTLIWTATVIPPQLVVFTSPGNISTATYIVKKTDGTQVASGTGWETGMEFSLMPDDYTLSITAYGNTQSHEFTVGSSSQVFDLSSLFCRVTITGLVFTSSVRIRNTLVATDVTGSTITYVLRSTSSLTVSATCLETYTGLSTNTVATYSNSSFTPNNSTVTVNMVATGRVIVLTSNGSITIPKAGSYKVLVMGGGGGGSGGGSAGGGGGGGGQVFLEDISLLASTYSVVIGSGGSGGSSSASGSSGRHGSSGQASSFDTHSASGGAGGTSSGGIGGSGGGGPGMGDGGDAYTFGGGGAGGTASNLRTYGGDGGTYGGNGAAGGRGADAGSGGRGTAGPIFGNSTTPSGGYGGDYISGNRGGGGGGGGGYAARGGNGGDSDDTAYGGGGGGGGGIAGGNGGNAGIGGKGYGAGGGGAGRDGLNNSGGGGGGYGSTKRAGNGVFVSANDCSGGDGANGCVVIQWQS